MSSPVRSVAVRLSLDPTSYVAGAARAETSTLALDAAAAKVGPHAATSMEQAAAGAGKAEGALGKLKDSVGALGISFGGLAGVGAVLGGALSVKWAADYQQALTKLTTTAGELPANLHLISQGMLDMAGQVGVGADELAKGMYTVESSGIHGADALTVLKAAAQGAKQEQADLGKVTDAVTTALHDYNLPASDAAKVTSQLITAVSHGKTTFDELTGAMHSVTPLAAALHVPLADVAGVLSSMTASGESADQAAQNMADALRHMQNPTSTMTAELGQLGINSADLATKLGTKGLSGTLQDISEAILTKVDPATQKVLLPAFNQSKSAAQDLQIMIGNMPPALAKLSQSLLDGATTQGEYQKAAKALGGQAGVLGDNFLGLYKSSDGFNNIIKAGGPAAQVYTAALQKAVGTSAGLTVALQVTGEHAAATNEAIKDIAGAAGDAQGNIKGWDEVQGNFNQRLDEFEAGAKSLAIEAGQHLLPALTGAFGFVDDDVIPGLKAAAGSAQDAAHWFSQLPQPVKDFALALAGLGLANTIGLTGRLTAGMQAVGSALGAAGASVGSFSDEMAVQQRLMQMEAADAELASAGIGALDRAFLESAASADIAAASLSNVQRMMFNYDAALALTTTEQEAAAASSGGLSAAMATLQARGLSAVKSGASGLINMFGGPWGAALAGATIGVVALSEAFAKEKQDIADATAQILNWKKAQDAGGQAGQDAAKKLQDYQNQIASLEKQVRNESGASQASIEVLKQKQEALAKANKEYDDYKASLTEVDYAQARVTAATNDLNNALKGGNPEVIAAARDRLAQATTGLANATDRQNQAQKTALQLDQEAATNALGAVDAALGAKQAQNQLALAVEQYNSDVKDGHLSSLQLQQEQYGLVDSAKQYAQGMADAAAAQAKANGQTDTASTSQAAYRQALLDAAQTLTGPARDAVMQLAASLTDSKVVADQTAERMKNLGITVNEIPNKHEVVIDAPTADQLARLHELGYVTTTLPNGRVVVTADTNPAIGEIQELLAYARQQSITIRASLPSLVNNNVASGSGRPGLATGGILEPFADGGWYTPMSGRIADVVAPRTYRLIGDNLTSDEAFIPIDGSQRSQQILGQTAARMGYGLTSAEQAAPVRTREMAAARGSGSAAGFDLAQLAAAVAAAIPDRPTVNVERWETTDGQTPYENAEALTFISRTRR